MPHFVIDCSSDVIEVIDEQHLIREVYQVALESELFDADDIKVRVKPFTTYLVGHSSQSFIHVFSSIMQGRTTEQRAALSRAVVTYLTKRFPEIPNVAMNVSEFEKATYCNRKMLES